jgi:hypothetical protein
VLRQITGHQHREILELLPPPAHWSGKVAELVTCFILAVELLAYQQPVAVVGQV